MDTSANDADDDAPSELLAPLLEEWREVLVTHVLSRLDPTDCAVLAQVAKPWLAVVVANDLPRVGQTPGWPLKIIDFVGSVARLAWAKENGCPWNRCVCIFLQVSRPFCNASAYYETQYTHNTRSMHPEYTPNTPQYNSDTPPIHP